MSPHGQENYQYTLGTKGANILLITPEGGTIRTLAYQESYTPNRNKVIGLCLPDLTKDEIPVGSDVYTL